ncbi:MAG: ABC transporter substrate-binding protein [Bdellovibrionota bacterium]
MKRNYFLSFAFALLLNGTLASADTKPYGNPSAPQGGTFNRNIVGEPTTLNPVTAHDAYGRYVLELVMDSLMVRNFETWEFMPGLAEKSEISKDGKSYTFTLREGAKFHDGKAVTVDDVKFSFDAIFDPKFKAAHLQPYYAGIEKVEIVDTKTVRFTAKDKYFQNYDMVAELVIVPKHVYGDPDAGFKKNKSPVGSGPYKLERWDKGRNIQLVRNKDWWGNSVEALKGIYNFEKVRMRFIKDEGLAIESLKKGDIDFQELSAENYEKTAVGPEWGSKVMKVKTENSEPKGYGYIGFNLRRDLFKERNVRLALYHLFNREELMQKYLYGMSIPATGPWYQQSEYADQSVKPIEFDPKKAADLFKKAGWIDADKNGILEKEIAGKKVEFRFTLLYGTKEAEKYLTPYQSDLRKYGVDMKLQLLEWNALSKNLQEGNYDTVALAWTGTVEIDPKQIWHSSSAVVGGSNYGGYSNPEVDKLIDEGRQEMDKKKRIAAFKKVYRLIAEDVPYIFWFNKKYVTYGYNPKMKMLSPTLRFRVGSNEVWWTQP